MNDLIGFIGLSGKVSNTAESGLYVDTLPDISIYITSMISTDDNDFISQWNEIESRGLKKFRTHFISELNRCYRINKIDVCECLAVSNKEILATSIWYLLGAEFMYERMNTSRMNRFTTIDREKVTKLYHDFMAQFQNELSIAVNGIDIANSTCMADEELECKPIIRTPYVIP